MRKSIPASDERSVQLPSSEGQWQLAEHLKNELTELGLANVQVTDKCYVLAELPANTEEAAPVIGLIAHMDTSSEAKRRKRTGYHAQSVGRQRYAACARLRTKRKRVSGNGGLPRAGYFNRRQAQPCLARRQGRYYGNSKCL